VEKSEGRGAPVGTESRVRPSGRPNRRERNHEERGGRPQAERSHASGAAAARPLREEKKRAEALARKKARAEEARRSRIEDVEARIAESERAIRELEQEMAAPGFYQDRATAQPLIDRHQALMWKVGELMHEWEQLSSSPDPEASHSSPVAGPFRGAETGD
jgi:hypothetical protein